MKIFVGSSTGKISLAEQIAVALEAEHFHVVRWWQDAAFPGGANTINRLVELSNECDGAAFVFGADDDCIFVDSSGGAITKKAPRDNVLLEYGIFVSKLGAERTQFLVEPNVKVPTDLSGITWCSSHSDIPKLVASLKQYRGLPKDSGLSARVQIYASRGLINAVKDGIPPTWGSRSLYIDYAGAEAWKKVESDIFYAGTKSTQAVGASIDKLAATNNVRDFGCAVSFGPGIGLLDRRILTGVVGKNLAQYIPIDINAHLAIAAADLLDAAITPLHVPFCITADFEEEMSVITQLVHAYARRKRVFIMLGGTFGNLESSENLFLKGLHDCMQTDDVAILDVSIAHTNYSIASDPYSDLTRFPDKVKRFLASGVERRCGTKIDEVLKDISRHIEFRTDSHKSQVKDTFAFEYRCKSSSQPLIYVKRYKFAELKTHLQNHDFEVVASESVGGRRDLQHRGIYFLKKK